MNIYRHRQAGYVLIVSYCFVMTVTVWIGLITTFTPILGIVFLIMSIVIFTFGWLTVMVDRISIKIRFGVGLISKKFRVTQIESVRQVQNRWYYGWGIRYTPHGWLYSVSGLSAIELQMKNGKRVRIGTDEPELLEEAINQILKHHSEQSFIH